MTNRRAGLGRCSIVLCVLLAAWISVACGKMGPSARGADLVETDHPSVGEPAPQFELPAVSGASSLTPTPPTNGVLLVDFWATWCEPCKDSFPKYQKLADEFGDALRIIAISEDDEDVGIAEFAKQNGAGFSLAWDSDKSIAHDYGIDTMPTLFIIDKSGVVRFVHQGFRPGDENAIRASIESLM